MTGQRSWTRWARLTIGRKFFGVLMVLWPLMLALAMVGVIGLRSLKSAFDQEFSESVHAGLVARALGADFGDAEEIALRLPLANVREQRQLDAALENTTVPAVDETLAQTRGLLSHAHTTPAQRGQLQQLERGWTRFLSLRESGVLRPATQSGHGLRRAALIDRQVARILNPLRSIAHAQASLEQARAGRAETRATRSYDDSLLMIWIIGAATVAVGVGAILLLTRNVVPRLRRYSQFAEAVAGGDLSARLRPRGSDELAALGRALDQMVEQGAHSASRRAAQDEFIDTLQVTDTEQVAHDLLKRQLERTIPGSQVTVLNRNNSANRLEAKTPLSHGDPLEQALIDATARSCLAVRFAGPHCEAPDEDRLAHCAICGGADRRATCQPLLVSGEVIGSVLAKHDDPLRPQDMTALQEAVAHAAPVLANLRNLALAERRALTDSLTGLSNKRAVTDTTKRMAAYTSRTLAPLTALALDLDHFKEINDTYGHDRGDAVLAAVGAALIDAVRASDFVGRNGGEEFLVLLPDTDLPNAMIVAERIREAIARITVAGITREITISVGIATIPDHAGDADLLLRSADRALYAAKANGRNRIETAQPLPQQPSTST